VDFLKKKRRGKIGKKNTRKKRARKGGKNPSQDRTVVGPGGKERVLGVCAGSFESDADGIHLREGKNLGGAQNRGRKETTAIPKFPEEGSNSLQNPIRSRSVKKDTFRGRRNEEK